VFRPERELEHWLTVFAIRGMMMTDSGRLKLERYNRDCTRIVDADGAVVALIEALCNGSWIISDLQTQQIGKRSFGTIRSAFAWFRDRDPEPTTQKGSDNA
jgi:hypothetical protein